MVPILGLFLAVLVAFNTAVYADDVTDLIGKAEAYEATRSVRYEVVETFQNNLDHRTLTRRYTLIKKGLKEVVQEGNSGTKVRKNKKDKVRIHDKIVESPAIQSMFESFLTDYQAGHIKAEIVTADSAIVLKGTREGLGFKIVFAKSPVVITAYETKDKDGKTVAKGEYTYNFSADPPSLMKSVESGTLIENGTLRSTYIKTRHYKNYAIPNLGP
jgi:hypothetical protein